VGFSIGAQILVDKTAVIPTKVINTPNRDTPQGPLGPDMYLFISDFISLGPFLVNAFSVGILFL